VGQPTTTSSPTIGIPLPLPPLPQPTSRDDGAMRDAIERARLAASAAEAQRALDEERARRAAEEAAAAASAEQARQLRMHSAAVVHETRAAQIRAEATRLRLRRGLVAAAIGFVATLGLGLAVARRSS
jgi:hypothetical protein